MKQNFTVRQGALDGVEAFLSVAQHRSFRKAAAELGVTPSAISQAVRALEARVGAALIASFCQAYPEVEVEIAASEELIDLAAEGFDAGIRLGQFIAADMVAVRLTRPFPLVVVGSPEYLRRCKRPERIDDLRQHACIRMRRSNGSIAPWSFVDGNKTIEAIVSGPLIANDFPTMLGAAIEGVGLAQVPEPIAASLVRAGKLVSVLEPFAPMAPGVFLYYPSRHQMTPKLRAFIDHVKSRSGATNKTRSHVDDKRTRGMKMR
jgi:DNA-binding transcriptional LysR family regulator